MSIVAGRTAKIRFPEVFLNNIRPKQDIRPVIKLESHLLGDSISSLTGLQIPSKAISTHILSLTGQVLKCIAVSTHIEFLTGLSTNFLIFNNYDQPMNDQSRRDCIWVENTAPLTGRSPVGTRLINPPLRILSLTGQVVKSMILATHINP